MILLLVACGPASVKTDVDVEDTAAESGGTDSAESGAESDSAEESGESEEVVLAGEASAAINAANPFSAVVTVTLDHAASVVVAYGEGALDKETPPVAVEAGVPAEVVVLGLRAERTFQLEARATSGDAAWASPAMEVTTAPLAGEWPSCSTTFHVDEAEFSRDEAICTNMSGSRGSLMWACTDRWGEPVFSVSTRQNDSLMSMRALRDGRWTSTSFTTSKLAVFDALGAQASQVTPGSLEGKTRFEHDYFDSHEAYQVPSGAWEGAVAFLTNSFEWFDDGSYKLGNGIVVYDLDTEEVLYDYNFHGELGDQEAMDELVSYDRDGMGDYAEDWNHGNTLLHGVEDNGREYLLVSLKAQDWIVKLYPDTDEIAWRLGNDGEFTLVDDIDAASPNELSPLEWQYHQHGVVFLERAGPRTRLLLLDNGYPRQDARGYRWDLYYSRILEMVIDEDTRRAQILFEYGDDTPHDPDWIFSSTCGNTLMLPTDDAVMTLLGESKHTLEVSYPGGEPRWERTCESQEWCEYRVTYFPTLYDRTWDQR